MYQSNLSTSWFKTSNYVEFITAILCTYDLATLSNESASSQFLMKLSRCLARSLCHTYSDCQITEQVLESSNSLINSLKNNTDKQGRDWWDKWNSMVTQGIEQIGDSRAKLTSLPLQKHSAWVQTVLPSHCNISTQLSLETQLLNTSVSAMIDSTVF